MPPKEKEEEKDTQGFEGIDPKFLAGLTFRGAEVKEVTEDGIKKKKSIPFERAMKPDDVLSWKDYGATVAIAGKDGRKYTVNKKGK